MSAHATTTAMEGVDNPAARAPLPGASNPAPAPQDLDDVPRAAAAHTAPTWATSTPAPDAAHSTAPAPLVTSPIPQQGTTAVVPPTTTSPPPTTIASPTTVQSSAVPRPSSPLAGDPVTSQSDPTPDASTAPPPASEPAAEASANVPTPKGPTPGAPATAEPAPDPPTTEAPKLGVTSPMPDTTTAAAAPVRTSTPPGASSARQKFTLDLFMQMAKSAGSRTSDTSPNKPDRQSNGDEGTGSPLARVGSPSRPAGPTANLAATPPVATEPPVQGGQLPIPSTQTQAVAPPSIPTPAKTDFIDLTAVESPPADTTMPPPAPSSALPVPPQSAPNVSPTVATQGAPVPNRRLVPAVPQTVANTSGMPAAAQGQQGFQNYAAQQVRMPVPTQVQAGSAFQFAAQVPTRVQPAATAIQTQGNAFQFNAQSSNQQPVRPQLNTAASAAAQPHRAMPSPTLRSPTVTAPSVQQPLDPAHQHAVMVGQNLKKGFFAVLRPALEKAYLVSVKEIEQSIDNMTVQLATANTSSQEDQQHRMAESDKSNREIVRLNKAIEASASDYKGVKISLDLRTQELADVRAQGKQVFEAARLDAEKVVEAEHNKLKEQLRKNTLKMTELDNEKQEAIANIQADMSEAKKRETQAKAEASYHRTESTKLKAEKQRLNATTTEQAERIKVLEAELLAKATAPPPSTPSKSSGESSAETPSSSKAHLKRELESEKMKNVHARQALSTMDTFIRALGEELGLELGAENPDDTFDQRGEEQRKSVRAIVKHLKDNTATAAVERALADQAIKHRQELAELKTAHGKALADVEEEASRAQAAAAAAAAAARPRTSTPLGGTRVAVLSGGQSSSTAEQEPRGSKRPASPTETASGSRQRPRLQSVASNTPTPSRARPLLEDQRQWIRSHLHHFIKRGTDDAFLCKACKLDDRRANRDAPLEDYLIGYNLLSPQAVEHVVDSHLETSHKLREKRIREGKE
ncbi:uncharacterized protein LOC62_03G004927 [Vanrija pseudolonga]|uniref:Uncharacterized protein n=1 Tax=Vanrija pseudolonga TaxID=143232 RepID=A0AAF0YCM7_9TREE|nr:hypothetical protein LOC62_03G004927 [Vanrija pseudolonga]